MFLLVPAQAKRAVYWIVAAIGLTAALGQIALTPAFRLGEASQIAPLEYAGLLWVVLLDPVIWQVLPDGMTWLGAAIIMGSGLYLIRREGLAASAARPPGADV